MNELITITFNKNHRCFKKGEEIILDKGLTVLMGEQGVGKSTLLNLLGEPKSYVNEGIIDIKSHVGPINTHYFDYEKHSHRTEHFFSGPMTAFSRWQSHGEYVRGMNQTVGDKVFCDSIIILDEPDASLSFQSIIKFYKIIIKASKNRHIIMSSHNPLLLSLFERAYLLNERKYIDPNLYIKEKLSALKVNISISHKTRK